MLYKETLGVNTIPYFPTYNVLMQCQY